MNEADYLLEMIAVEKHFPGVKALKGVDFRVKPMEIHALVGENGAGKSTLMKCLMGMYSPNGGEIYFNGEKIENYNVREAIDFGIVMIHQELSPVPDRTIMSNIFLGREPKTSLGLIDWKRMYKETQEWLEVVGVDDDPKTPMNKLTVAKTQMVEIARAISNDAKLIIMDEPTSALSTREVDHLFTIMNKLKEQGKSMIYISHKLDEIYEVTDRISVLRDGTYIGTEDTNKLELNEMIHMMVGREVTDMFPKTEGEIGDTVLQVTNLNAGPQVKDITFNVRKGEILGLAGLVGAGRTELVETVFGIRKKDSGKIILNGEEVNIKNSHDAIDHGFALLTEDRRHNGIFPILDINFNTTVANLNNYISPLGLIKKPKQNQDTKEYIEKINIRTPSAKQLIQNLSGGNQQKVLVARWLLTDPKIMILDEPTRGIDVGAKSEIHRLIDEMSHEGMCVIMISSELPEIMGMSDRIMVMHEGKVTGILENTPDLTQEVLMEYASGLKDDFIDSRTEEVEEIA